MTRPLHLCVCLFLLTACSARPNWHKGLTKQNDQLLQVEAVDQKNHDTFKNTNSDEDKTRFARQAPNPFFFGTGFPARGHSNFNNPQFQFSQAQNFGPPFDRQQFQQPGLQPIGQLASTLQNIIGSHLDATVQRNKDIHFGTFGNVYPHPPGLRPLQPPPCPSCTHHTHSFHETTHFEIGRPQMIPTGTHIHQFETICSGGETGCREIPVHNHPGPVNPLPSQPGKEIPNPQPPTVGPTTTTEQQEIGDGKNSDIVYGNDDKDSKTLDSEDNVGIDIRFGGANSEDVLPSKSNTHEEPHQESAEERVNLHHTLKDLQHSASKAVKDMHKYIHQQLNTVAKTSVEKIGKPLATVVLGPAILVKETLDALAGKRRPPPEEAISSWCPSCTENDNFDHTQTQYHSLSIPQIPCYKPNCHNSNEPDHSVAENSPPSQGAKDQETQKQEDTSFVTHEKPNESDFVYPNESNIESKGDETNIDIRFGNDSA